jgi:hypothetical protein
MGDEDNGAEELTVGMADVGLANGRCPFRGIVLGGGGPAHTFMIDERCPSGIPAMKVQVYLDKNKPDEERAGSMLIPVLREGTPCHECMETLRREEEAGFGKSRHKVSDYRPARRRASGRRKPRRKYGWQASR